MPKEGYTSVSISNEIIEKIDVVIESGKTTYRTRSDFIKDALRIRLRELGIIK
jgi:Arc/MetJ-type ribon-helix-helix transcriptional regulator